MINDANISADAQTTAIFSGPSGIGDHLKPVDHQRIFALQAFDGQIARVRHMDLNNIQSILVKTSTRPSRNGLDINVVLAGLGILSAKINSRDRIMAAGSHIMRQQLR